MFFIFTKIVLVYSPLVLVSFNMLKTSTPFRQFAFVFKLFGFQPNKIFKVHKIAAFLTFIICEFVYGMLMIMAIFQFINEPEYAMELVFQSPFIFSIWFKAFYFFLKFERMENFKTKMCELFKKCDENFSKALETSKKLSLIFFAPSLSLGIFATVFSFLTKSKVLLFWTPPITVNANLLFYLHWFEQSVGIFYNNVLFSTMDLYPFCIMIMLQAYLENLNKKFSNASDKEEFLKCVKMQIEIRDLISEFQEIFSPLLLVQAFSMVISFCATLLILASNVS